MFDEELAVSSDSREVQCAGVGDELLGFREGALIRRLWSSGHRCYCFAFSLTVLFIISIALEAALCDSVLRRVRYRRGKGFEYAHSPRRTKQPNKQTN